MGCFKSKCCDPDMTEKASETNNETKYSENNKGKKPPSKRRDSTNDTCCDRETCKRRNPDRSRDNEPCCPDEPECSRRPRKIVIYLDDDEMIQRRQL